MNDGIDKQVLAYQMQSFYAQLHDQRVRVEALLGKLVVWEKSVLHPLAKHLQDKDREQS
jgi:hypothetical protein